MLLVFQLLLLILALVISGNILILLVECTSALLGSSSTAAKTTGNRDNFRILIPAHNEAVCLERTIAKLLPQVPSPEQILVIADNCEDDTAAIAQRLGVTVLERENREQRGKGYALAYGLDYLAANPPEIVIFVDADCLMEDNSIDALVAKTLTTGKPVQGLYLMEKPANPTPRDAISAFAFLVKNWVRPLGLSRLGLPCLLTGTGMAFPWEAITQVSLADGNIVEDMQLGLNLAMAGYPPLFCPEAEVTGILPQTEQIAKTQRTRWEHGHLQTIINQVPGLLKGAITQGSWQLTGLALELSVPPLSLLVMIWTAGMVLTVIGGYFLGFWLPTLILSLGGLSLFLAIILAWVGYGRNTISLTTLIAVPFYVIWKITVYLTFLIKPESKWVKTARDEQKQFS